MINQRFNSQDRILTITPEGKVSAEDFNGLEKKLELLLIKYGKLNGVLLDLKEIPFWSNFSSFLTHMRFIKKHHEDIDRLAVVTNKHFIGIVPWFADFFTTTDLKYFKETEKNFARLWLADQVQEKRKAS